jgi:hypothetical protein
MIILKSKHDCGYQNNNHVVHYLSFKYKKYCTEDRFVHLPIVSVESTIQYGEINIFQIGTKFLTQG